MTANGEVIAFNPDDFTVGDLEDFEDIVGVPFDEAFKEVATKDEDGKVIRDEKGRPVKTVKMGAKTLKALVYLTKRAENPDFTLEDARKVKVSELVMGTEVDPKD